jgi:2-(3-amino-3-carboxypropyl)histidine synthase
MAFNFENEKLIKELKKIKPKPKKVLVQLPEGLKQNAFDILKVFEELKIDAVFSGETCWGGCSLAVDEAKAIGADLIVHFGHSEFIKLNDKKIKVIYIEVKDELDLMPILKKSLEKLKNYKKMGFSCSVQHIQDIDKIIKFYRDNNKQVVLSEKLGKVNYQGQILGCQYSGLKAIQDKVDVFVILGNEFHATGALMSLNKPVILLDIYNDKIQDFPGLKEKVIRQRAIAIEKFKEAKKVGVILELKPGQKFGSEKLLIEKLRKIKKQFIVISMDEITNEKLRNFYDIDCFIELACPRIAIDDVEQFEKPLLTFKEAMVGLGEKSWNDFLKEGLI